MSNIAKTKIQKVREIVGTNQVILGLSGGVDSSVVAALLYKAIGNQLIPVFIDNGLLRKNEMEKVKVVFQKYLTMEVIVVDAKENFYNALKGLVDPEDKRKAIGRVFVEEFTKVKYKYKNAKFLAQGTIYPDVIESAGENGTAHIIKSHHNVGSLPKELDFEILEPIRDLFKDEVRKLGRELSLPKELVMRHPFPGPGLAIRIIGEVTKRKVKTLQDADDIFISNLIKANLYHSVSQAATILTSIKTVGVQGDRRTYKNLLALRAVNTTDFMTASFSRIDFEFLDNVATEIINKVDDVNRVVYDINSKPPGTIE
jgi:GMP synthase (glutamine-hydrolysing)